MRELKENEIEELMLCGRVGFSYKEVAAIFELDSSEVRAEFEKECGSIFATWNRGRLQAELDLRQAILTGALKGSTPMLEKMLCIYSRVDEIHRGLY